MRRAVKFECGFLDPLLEVSIIDIDPELRVKGKLSAVVRAVSKNFTYEGCKEIYAKGKGLVYYSFTLKHDPTAIIAVIERYDLGVRFDIEFEACVAVMLNYSSMMRYLKHSIDLNPTGNIS